MCNDNYNKEGLNIFYENDLNNNSPLLLPHMCPLLFARPEVNQIQSYNIQLLHTRLHTAAAAQANNHKV